MMIALYYDMNAINYIDDKATVTGESFGACLSAYLIMRNISRNKLAGELGISGAAMAYYVSGKNKPSLDTFERICDVLGVEIRRNGKYSIHEYREAQIRQGRKISKNDIDSLANRFFVINQDLIDMDSHEIPVYDLQEYLVERETGINTLIAQLSPTEKRRIEEIGAGNSLREKIIDLHRRGGELVLDQVKLLGIAVRAHIRQHIGDDPQELIRDYFPGEYSFDVKNYEQAPF